ncbi:hypothetical protein GQ44DRAFT_725980 [Phaeosphaeriaceae sp. PMI808]|nr:hypothetical protein GQ44DRAFT_725980 [Phaeosphaeriaceae sp. PMI808]
MASSTRVKTSTFVNTPPVFCLDIPSENSSPPTTTIGSPQRSSPDIPLRNFRTTLLKITISNPGDSRLDQPCTISSAVFPLPPSVTTPSPRKFSSPIRSKLPLSIYDWKGAETRPLSPQVAGGIGAGATLVVLIVVAGFLWLIKHMVRKKKVERASQNRELIYELPGDEPSERPVSSTDKSLLELECTGPLPGFESIETSVIVNQP